jgi:hypothetical protein
MEVNTSLPIPKFELGVLLVHGIGTQPSGDTLVRWGDVLLKTIRRASRNKVVVTVERAGHADFAGMDRLEAAVRFRAGDHAERWLLREGWWADAFPAASYRELVSWSVRALPWAIVTYIGDRYWQSSSRHQERRMVAGAGAIGALVVALFLVPVLIIFLGLSLLLGLFPIPYIRKHVLAIQSTLTATVGDCLAFVESPLRAALIRACILDGLVRLKQLCKHTVIVAHSQGAAAVLDALGGIVEPGQEREAEAASGLVPDALVTFGAGTNQLASQKLLAAGGLPKMLGMNPAFVAVWALLGVDGVLLWLYWTTTAQILWGQGLLLAVAFFLVAGIWLIHWLARRDLTRRARLIGTASFVFLAPVGFLLWLYAVSIDFPIASESLLAQAFLLFAWSASLILSSGMKEFVTAPVRTPPGLARWDDLYASADPVSNGPTRAAGATGTSIKITSIKIWNLGSMFSDHTAYWNNRDGFALRVARVCAETAQSPWRGELPSESDYVDERAAWRVRFLQIARWSTFLAPIIRESRRLAM